MNAQYRSSVSHERLISNGLSVVSHVERGAGDASFSVVEYSDGQVWIYDNGSATPCGREVVYTVNDLGFSSGSKLVDMSGLNLHDYFDAVIPSEFSRAWIAQHYLGPDQDGVGVALLEDLQ